MIDRLADIVGHPLERNHIDTRPGDVPHSQADNTLLRSLFPDVAPVPLDDGLRATVAWMRDYLAVPHRRERRRLLRAPGVVWRLGPDRVLLHALGACRPAQDLFGVAALVWIVLDEPCSSSQLAVRLNDADIEFGSRMRSTCWSAAESSWCKS